MWKSLTACIILALFLLAGCFDSVENNQDTGFQSKNVSVDNEYYQMGVKLKGDFTLENNNTYVALVAGEPIRLSEWNYMVCNMEGKKTQKEILQNFIHSKTQVAAAKKRGLMPSDEDLSEIINNTKQSLSDMTSPLALLLQGAELINDEYCEIMKPQWIDKLAVSNWQTYVNESVDDSNMDLETMDKSDYSKIFYSKAIEELDDSAITITKEGLKAGLDSSWIGSE